MKTVYKNLNILNGRSDMTLQENMMIVVENEKIVAITATADVSADKVVDCQGKYVIPGLINMHVHTPGSGFPKKKESDSRKLAQFMMSNPVTSLIAKAMCKNYVQTELYSGTTTIRTVGGLGHIDSSLRDDIQNNKFAGPRMLTSDMAVTIPGGHMEGSVAYGAKDDEDFVRFIKENVKSGVNWIKIMITGGVLDAKVKGEPGEMRMNAHQVKLCCDTAHTLGLKVCAHVESPKGVVVALENGVDTIEHGSDMDEATLALFKERNASLICTISPAVPLSKISPEITKANEMVVYNSQVLMDSILEGTKKCLKNGVKVGLGTDTVCPFVTHYDMWRELEYAHKLLGVSRKEALYLGTLSNAEILGLDQEIGSLEVGKSADFVVVNDNPLDGFSTIRQPVMVCARGKLYEKLQVKKSPLCEEELDKYLASLN